MDQQIKAHILARVEHLLKKAGAKKNIDRQNNCAGLLAAALQDGTSSFEVVNQEYISQLNQFSFDPEIYNVRFEGNWIFCTVQSGGEIITLFIDPDGKTFWMYERYQDSQIKEAYISASPINFKIK